jgi:hypothetical protein
MPNSEHATVASKIQKGAYAEGSAKFSASFRIIPPERVAAKALASENAE